MNSHNELGNGEKYHAYLRKVYKTLRMDLSNINCKHVLRLAVKAVKYTTGPAGLVSALMVFGVLPQLPVHTKDLREQRDRMREMLLAGN